MILPYSRKFSADAVEHTVPDASAACALVRERAGLFEDALARRRAALAPLTRVIDIELVERCDNAMRIAYARLALRHGRWGKDFHAYHNEGHILEIFDARLPRLLQSRGVGAFALADWLLLGLFAACHDLRQREVAPYRAGVGANERASIDESFRILDVAGFDRHRDASFYLGLELTIAGSTFDARPPDRDRPNPAEIAQAGGALAAKLETKLDKHARGWREDTRLVHAHALALVAADLDTANVAEPFPRFIETGVRLCIEREMRSQRCLNEPESLHPVTSFLTEGQERFFFELHRFNSESGRLAFAAAKIANAAPLTALTAALRERAAHSRTGEEVLVALREIVPSPSQ